MSMIGLMLQQLAIARRIVTDGLKNVPAWRIETPEGAWLILTRFDPDQPGQSDRCGALWHGSWRKRGVKLYRLSDLTAAPARRRLRMAHSHQEAVGGLLWRGARLPHTQAGVFSSFKACFAAA
jgi:hypothetical protein